jgi:hypothetical protein
MGKKNKKNKASKLPKTIAGVKVPKELRNAGGMLARLARDPAAREVALAALTAALAARKDSRQAVRNSPAETATSTEKSGRSTSWMSPALTAAAAEAGRLLLDAYDRGGKRNNAKANSATEAQDDNEVKPANGNKKVAQGSTH